jgi:hypothetical protein
MMGDSLYRLLDAVAHHRRLAAWTVAAVAALALTGGVALGEAAGSAANRVPAPAPAPARAAPTTLPQNRTAVQGVVLEVRPRGLLLLMGNGRRTVVITDAATAYRRDGHAVSRAALRRGQRVVVLGRVGEAGFLRARVVALRGQVHPLPAANEAATPAR